MFAHFHTSFPSLNLQESANNTPDYACHAVKAQVIRVLSVYSAGIPFIALEEAVPIEEIDIGIAILEGVPVGGENHVPALGIVLLVHVKIRASNQEDWERRLLPSNPLIKRLMGAL